MQIDYSPRGAGKTERMIKWLKEQPDRILITFSEKEADRLRTTYDKQDQFAFSRRICTWNEYVERCGVAWRMEGRCEMAIDNADIVLESLVRHRISMISISDERSIYTKDDMPKSPQPEVRITLETARYIQRKMSLLISEKRKTVDWRFIKAESELDQAIRLQKMRNCKTSRR